MANNIGTLITAEIRPQSEFDTIASAFANEIRGGWHNVSSIVERDAIYDARKRAGMACYVTDVSAAYVWDGSNWNEFGTTSTVPTSATFLADYDDRYVNVTGDTMTGQLAGITGDASAPSFTFTGDSNTGVYSPASDTMSIATNGGESMRIFSDGGVQIGGTYTASPGANSLQVTSIAGTNGNIVTHDANGKLLDSGILASSLATNISVASISGDLQSQIDAIVIPDVSEFITTAEVASISGDLQSQINNITIVAGSNVTIVESPTDTWTISASISGSSELEYVSVPSSPTDTGTQGQRAYGSNYVYECITTNTWVRYAVATSW